MNGASSMMNYQYAIRYTLHASRSDRASAQKYLIMQNKPNLPRFYAKNEDFAQKQSQTNPIQTQFKANSKPIKPNQTQFPKGQNERKFCFNKGL